VLPSGIDVCRLAAPEKAFFVYSAPISDPQDAKRIGKADS